MSDIASLQQTPAFRYRLGLDIGANSIGWAAIRLSDDPKDADHPVGLVGSGVRIFEAGVEGSIEQGKDSSRASERRTARQQRRQTWRRQFRKRRLFVLLQRHGLLPATDASDSAARDAALKALDGELSAVWCAPGDLDAHQKLPYLLRFAAAQRLVQPFELGRALYHLGQRRGYKANRRTPEADDEQQGAVSTGISVLDQARQRNADDPSSLRSLAETVVQEFRYQDGHFAIQSESRESSRRGRVRGHYTSRQMYIQEFTSIRDYQLAHGGPLSAEDWAVIEKVLFRQRPLKSQSHLVGRCSLEKNRHGRGARRCLMALPEFQEFRLLQSLNHLMILQADGSSQPLMPGQREVLYEFLMREGDLKLQTRATRGRTAAPSVISLLGLPRGTRFSLRSAEDTEEDDVRLIGNRTNSKLRVVLGEQWDSMTDAMREKLILQLVFAWDPVVLRAWLQKHYGFSAEIADQVARITLEEQHAGLSRKAIRKLLPRLRAGDTYAAARQAEYPESFHATKALDTLPPVITWNREISNPAVIRALTELRRVVNSLLRRFGKPESIHVELARDLKRSREERKKVWMQNDENRRRREKARVEILNQLGNSNPSGADVEKWLLAEECNWRCPYTGRAISATSLKDFDVEHIYPRQYLDDSFGNKTLCDPEFNRGRKRNRLPSEILDGEDLEALLQRVRAFTGPFAEAKLRRFQAEAVAEGFVDRQLNDTRYNSRVAAEYLGVLYGGRNDASGRQRIMTPTGGLTWLIRRGFGLDRILSSGDHKERGDHRHHAVDAICVALSTQKVIHRLSGLAAEFARPGQRFNAFLLEFSKALPWDSFQTDALATIQRIIVSHRPDRAIAGGLHAKTYYSKPLPDSSGTAKSGRRSKGGNGPATEHRVRKSLDSLKQKEIEGDAIVDPGVRAAVQRKYRELAALATSTAGRDPEKLWNDRSKLDRFPRLTSSKKNGEGQNDTSGSIIFSVRIRTTMKARPIGKGLSPRYVGPGSDANLASLIYEVLSADGAVRRWDHEILSRMEAHERLTQARRAERQGKTEQAMESERPVERILFPRTADEIRAMEDPPFRLKPDDTVRLVGILRKNDMVELDAGEAGRQIYRVQSISANEIQLCEHTQPTIDEKRRTPMNRIQSIDNLRKRRLCILEVSPIGIVDPQP